MIDEKKPMGMGSRYLRLCVRKNGDTLVEAFGFEGTACEEATRGLENALGQVRSRTKKDDEGGGNFQSVG